MNYTKTQVLNKLFFDLVKDVKESTNIDIIAFSKKRERKYVRIRGVMIAIIFENLVVPLAEVGELFGLDHSTIIHYRQNHRENMRQDDIYLALYMAISKKYQKINTTDLDLPSLLLTMKKTFKIPKKQLHDREQLV